MAKFTLLGTIAILSTMTAAPALAQAAIQEPGAYACYHANTDLGIGSTPFWPRDALEASGLTSAMASATLHIRRSYASISKHARNRGAESLAMSARAQVRTSESSALPQANGSESREVAAPPWSAACMTDHGPSQCGEPMWIYGSSDAVARYGNAF
jgi:hypothetical protein